MNDVRPGIDWKKSSRSMANANCVEIAAVSWGQVAASDIVSDNI